MLFFMWQVITRLKKKDIYMYKINLCYLYKMFNLTCLMVDSSSGLYHVRCTSITTADRLLHTDYNRSLLPLLFFKTTFKYD